MFGFSIFNIKNGCISRLVPLSRVAASFITSKFLEHNTENEEFEKSRVLQKCPLTHITPIIIVIIVTTLIILRLKASNNLQQFKYKNNIKQDFTDMLKN